MTFRPTLTQLELSRAKIMDVVRTVGPKTSRRALRAAIKLDRCHQASVNALDGANRKIIRKDAAE